VAVVGSGSEEEIIGGARYGATATDGDCEFAVAVVDEWHGRGRAGFLLAAPRLSSSRRWCGKLAPAGSHAWRGISSPPTYPCSVSRTASALRPSRARRARPSPLSGATSAQSPDATGA